ncbi:RNA polymerase, sigma subunit, ECF family [Duganella sacchari]|uniref:RNA polymerase, sigma subunit, ECF family n=1 Tax=Duganella sacchari TaxID=551987 RepID=A0A1M7QMZ8_9BURK|nr:sigma-70 family RNA polymerase sigma factor [Duganella sacchari]SHN32690.1 RNA polymerase, sigma subunit, ECF family [Duganella sacchari]
MSTDPSDETLMLRYAGGDAAAFRELYQRHQRGLYRFVAWRSPRRDWVDEVAQESWIALHQARERYQVTATFRTFLYQIARNRLIDLQRQSPHLSTDDAPDLESEVPAAEAMLETQQLNAALHRAIRALPGEQKEALVLQQFSGLSLEEIAALTSAPIETVKSRLRYAMRKLREQLSNGMAAQEEQA